jgi:CoA:oxalate CoA-transferase
MSLPLQDVVVVDLTQYLAGPFGTQILGDLGAEVLKVETPSGDISRDVPPETADGLSSYYLSINRNKKSIALDLKTESARAIVQDLIRRADVVVENFRPGVADRLGVGWEQARSLNPKIVYCSVSGFGQDGPSRDLPAFDMVAQAVSGVMSVNGHAGSPSARVGVPIGDIVAGMYGSIAVLAGLQHRDRHNEGIRFDVSMLDSQVAMLSYLASAYLATGVMPGPQGRGHQSIPTYRSFTCKDDVEIVVAANTDNMWPVLCEALDVPHLVDDPRFADPITRLSNRALLDPLLEAAFRNKTSDEALALLRGKVPSSRINNVTQALEDPQVLHRDMVTELLSPRGEVARVVGSPVKIVGQPSPATYPPHKGEHRSEILKTYLGFTDEQERDAAATGAFGKQAAQ